MFSALPTVGLVERVRRDFPQLSDTELVYLDSASTAQKPRQVIDALRGYYERSCANVHRGLYPLAERATADFEAARDTVARFCGAYDRRGVVFTRSCTEATNLVAYSWARQNLGPGDEVLVTRLEHHSNFLPWMQAAQERGASLRVLDIDDQGGLDLSQLSPPRGWKTKLVAVSGMSNVLGVGTPLGELTRAAHDQGALIVVDGAQLAMHQAVDVAANDWDFFAFSGHKVLGPTGVGALVARPELLESMEPFISGGEMVLDVTDAGARWNDIPYKFEAGTPPIAQVIGLGAALSYIEELGFDWIGQRDRELSRHGCQVLDQVEGLRLYGPKSADQRAATFAFNLFDRRGQLIHPHDVGQFLAQDGVSVRVGHHCAKPLMRHFDTPAMVRASACIYNREDELDRLAQSLDNVVKFFG